MHCYRILLSSEVVEGGTTPNVEAEPKGTGKSEGIEALKAKYEGDLNRVIDKLYDDRYRAAEAKRLAEAKVPPPDSLVLSAEEARDWKALRTLGPTEDVKRKVREFDGLDSRVKGYEHRDTLADIARIEGYDLDVFTPLAAGLSFEVKEEDAVKDGKTVKAKVSYVKGDGDTSVKTADYMAERHPKQMPVLKPEAKAPEVRGTPRQPVTGRPAPQGEATTPPARPKLSHF